MPISSENHPYEELRSQILALGPRSQGGRLPTDLHDWGVLAAHDLRSQGFTWQQIGEALGVTHQTARSWGLETPPDLASSFRPVSILETGLAQESGTIRLVSPSGWVIETDDVEIAVALIERLVSS